MRAISVKQRAMLVELNANLMDVDLWGWRKGIELFHGCGRWLTAFALERRGLVGIRRNENEQVFVFLRDRLIG